MEAHEAESQSPIVSRASAKKELHRHFRDNRHVWVFIELERGKKKKKEKKRGEIGRAP
jgi:electron transfer flavoprotein alpha subunit